MENQKKKIYPFQFESMSDEHAWGKETWVLSDLGFRDSGIANGWLAGNTIGDVMETYLERIVGEEVYNFYGRQFPVMVKKLEVAGNYGLYVCPDDIVAEERYDALGKKKLWYVLDAQEDARIYLGLKREISARDLYEKCQDGSILEEVNEIVPAAGAHYEIDPGLIHGLSGHVTIVEIAESSNMDLKIYDWGLDAASCEEDLVSAIDFVELGKYCRCHWDPEYHCDCHHEDEDECGHDHEDGCCCHEHEHDHECSCGHDHEHEHECGCGQDAIHKMTEILLEGVEFTTTALKLTDPIHIYTEKFTSFILYYCAKGEAALQVRSEEADGDQDILHVPTDFYVLKEGEVVLVPGESPDFLLVPRAADTYLLETILDHREIPDEYINPGKEDEQPVDEDEDSIFPGMPHPKTPVDPMTPGPFVN